MSDNLDSYVYFLKKYFKKSLDTTKNKIINLQDMGTDD